MEPESKPFSKKPQVDHRQVQALPRVQNQVPDQGADFNAQVAGRSVEGDPSLPEGGPLHAEEDPRLLRIGALADHEQGKILGRGSGPAFTEAPLLDGDRYLTGAGGTPGQVPVAGKLHRAIVKRFDPAGTKGIRGKFPGVGEVGGAAGAGTAHDPGAGDPAQLQKQGKEASQGHRTPIGGVGQLHPVFSRSEGPIQPQASSSLESLRGAVAKLPEIGSLCLERVQFPGQHLSIPLHGESGTRFQGQPLGRQPTHDFHQACRLPGHLPGRRCRGCNPSGCGGHGRGAAQELTAVDPREWHFHCRSSLVPPGGGIIPCRPVSPAARPKRKRDGEAWVRRRTRRLTAGAGKARLPVPLIVT